jgi:hypothetical protein
VVRALALVAVLACVLGGCDAGPVATTQPVEAKAIAHGFVLEMSMPKAVYAAGEPIPVTTTLTWTGADPRTTVWTFGGGPVTFEIKQLDGPLFAEGAVHTADCGPKEFARDVVNPIPFQKSGAWDHGDPNAAFYRQYFADPVLRLPPGRWQLRVGTVGQIGACEAGAPSMSMDLPPIAFEVR